MKLKCSTKKISARTAEEKQRLEEEETFEKKKFFEEGQLVAR